MRVALFTDTFYPKIDGVVVSITSLIERLAPRGFRFLVFCPDYHMAVRHTFPAGTTIVPLPSLPLPHYRDFRFVFPFIGRCRRESEDFGAELVHIHSYANLGFVGAEVARRLGVPLLGTYHTLAAEFTRYLSPVTILGLDRLLSHLPVSRSTLPRNRWNPVKHAIWHETIRLFNRCDAVIAPSKLTARELHDRGLRAPLYSISNGIDLSHFPHKPRGRWGTRLIHVGRISFEKRVDIVIQAFARIQRELSDATLTIVGNGPALTGLRVLAEKLGVSGSVRFVGFVAHDELAPVYQGHDLFLTASPMETQGVVLLESMSCGLPVIGIDRGAIPDLVRDDFNGYVVGMPHAATMARKAVELLSDRELLKRLSRGAFATVAEHDSGTTTARIERLYRELADSSKAGVYSSQ